MLYSHLDRCSKLVFFCALLALGCKNYKKIDLKPIVVYDGWWANDYAATDAERSCNPEIKRFTHKPCVDIEEARQKELIFHGRFATLFQADPVCSKSQLIMYLGPGKTSKDVTDEYVKLPDNSYWGLMVSFKAESERQTWQLSISPSGKHNSSGESSVEDLVHTVCSIVGGRGGSVSD